MSRITLQPLLIRWIDAKLPALDGVQRVKIFACKKLPFEIIYHGQRFSGLTLWDRVYIRDTFVPMDSSNVDFVGILLHELFHVLQFKANPLLCPLKYLYLSARHGYWENPMETVVYEQSEVLLKEYRADAPWENP